MIASKTFAAALIPRRQYFCNIVTYWCTPSCRATQIARAGTSTITLCIFDVFLDFSNLVRWFVELSVLAGVQMTVGKLLAFESVNEGFSFNNEKYKFVLEELA